MLSHQVNYDFNLIESSVENSPDFTFKLFPLRHSALGDLWKLENSEVFFIAPCNFVVVFKCISIGGVESFRYENNVHLKRILNSSMLKNVVFNIPTFQRNDKT
jgi:hypothetical protein